MSRSGKLSDRQRKALDALLVTPTVVAAAERCGLSRATIFRYLRDPEFKKRYAEERAHLTDQTVAGLQKLGISAVNALRRNLDAESDPSAQIRAARSVLQYLFKGVEQVEIEERLRALEEEDDEQGF